jgi:putative transposase
LRLLRRLDELYLDYPFFGSRRMAVTLEVNRKRIQRLSRIAGIEALYPKPNLSRPQPGHEIYPYLLRGVSIERPNQVWGTDITYIPMRGGFLYLVAVMDWFSRFVLSWELSNTMETGFCLAALDAAFRFGQPEIWNSDQGSQFTAADFLAPLKKRGISISMDGRGRALDKAYASHCTSFAHCATTGFMETLFENLTPWAFRGGLAPGCSYKQSFLPL